jgi:hypothetical protein
MTAPRRAEPSVPLWHARPRLGQSFRAIPRSGVGSLGDPVADIAATGRVAFVMKEGAGIVSKRP